MNEKNILIMASGSGSNAEAIVKGAQAQALPMRFVCGCDKKPEKAGVYEKMEKLGVTVHYLPAPYGDHSALSEFMKNHKPDLTVLAGYMRILPPEIADKYDILNIHPSILPFVYKGSMDAYQDAMDADDKYTGCTVHRVTSDVDAGERVGQIAFEIPEFIKTERDIGKLKAIGLSYEHALYLIAINSVLRNESPDTMLVARVAAANLKVRGLPMIKTIVPLNNAPVFAEFCSKELACR
ncbi:MAG: hypothetical protein FWG39_02135 [Alphaproteobacteria bacterium]|nr:hypothetical protein [Alphaproteobacteria bacterium]